ncbi:anti-sigma factor [Lacinutrix neustonica]|uniref:Anti-sigma factor n=1 Tax=Lacinutrix neustonica TaxID=2980107 RepID=A0A9E8MZ24_9FLAO|nr:anti-sigma factor [Lacinutrix neustonica]WAC03646.1 anti-sigma factor [Lacinutrix neustonica]
MKMIVDSNTFLESGLLEKYLIGQTSPQETLEVEQYISKYPEVDAVYQTLQNNLELSAFANAEEAPVHLLGNILSSLDDTPVIAMNTTSFKSWFGYGIAASVVALLFASTSFYLYTQNDSLLDENQTIVEELYDLRSDIANNNLKLDALADQFAQLNNPETEKYILKGNRRAKNLKAVAYINPKEKTSMLDVVSLPILPDDKVYQIWADLQGKMVNLGILSERDRRLQQIPYTEDALGLSITIERKGKLPSTSTETPVAEIELNLKE